ncbi:hypothetical protein EC396_01960 [Lutibacter sp. HS1-25]|uniref:hypothetical protein n=1 Tax=Lutibacter sp. HS1-25 TaxID=2485000 RepID=UPI001011F612|nr:hypothetical protein [Lutibacter sp. HS1-25]RXP63593.1 hypothetical protein EC396_01960 [Lutibacter sp. HS1-25]
MKNKIIKDWQNREKSVQELHNDSIEWISEINFINDEIRFLEHLLSAKYIDCLAAGLYKKIDEFVDKLKEQKTIGKTLKVIIREQEAILLNLINNDSVSSNKNYLENNKKLEFEMDNYIKKYRRLKKQIFKIVENIMKQKDQKKLV